MAHDEKGKWIPGTTPEYPDDLTDVYPGFKWPTADKAKASMQESYDHYRNSMANAFVRTGVPAETGFAEEFALRMCGLPKEPDQMTVEEYAEIRGLPMPQLS